jgi:hypothetical protein
MDVENPLNTGMNKGGLETWFQRLFGYFFGVKKVSRRRNRGQPKSSFIFDFKLHSINNFHKPMEWPILKMILGMEERSTIENKLKEYGQALSVLWKVRVEPLKRSYKFTPTPQHIYRS